MYDSLVLSLVVHEVAALSLVGMFFGVSPGKLVAHVNL